ncbi:MAG: branched-chain amino acid ABC transporter permease [Chloroflexota bacterium]|nr:branched-chain amino acid ABC transporter permease [Chloroflexota bacterium]MDE2840990.1 branched-chain amino acid ABC transporter permease [Chloroflexota bacterium]MDE2931597.1 branched-chain amino acid ABC transporter permease [Chloroflexota bacterium]
MIALVVDGIILGSILSLGAVSLTLVYGIVRFANFAHGDLMAVGAYVAFFLVNTAFVALGLPDATFGPLSFGLPMALALPVAMLVTAGVAVVVDRLVFRPMRQRGYAPVMFVIGSLAVAFAIRALLFIIWGPEFHFFTQALRPALQLPFEVRVKPDQIFILLACLTMVAGLYLFLQRSKIGKALRATADNPDLARVSGINTEHMLVWTWALGAAMAATAGILLGIDAQLRPEMGWNLLLPLFAAAILGGIGNPYGALVGGMIIGIVQQVSTAFLLPTYKPAVAFVILILVLLIRPRGILGSEQRGF